MPERDFLDARHEIHARNDEAWAREERRFFGGDAVLTELVQWKNENAAKYQKRQEQAQYLNFGEQHGALVAGHIVREMPVPNYGALGDVRERKRITTPTAAELLHYNVNGVGSDGAQLPDWVATQIKHACATGGIWTLVEMPPPPRGRSDDGRIRQADVLAGHRPYYVSFSRRAVPYWEITRGQTDWAVARVPIGTSRVVNGAWQSRDTRKGYYLWVREGYTGLGDEYAGGGWWMYDADRNPVTDDDGNPVTGTWQRTKGQIPLSLLKVADTEGTQDWPADSRSLTMELGQISVGLMNRISERDWNASDSGKSIKFLLGGDKTAHNLVAGMLDEGAIFVTVPGVETTDGKFTVPTLYNSADGAIAAEFFTTIINSNIASAHEIMVRQITSTPDSSGRSKEAGFGEATSPLLASLSAKVESWLNALIYFAELRAGADAPSGFITLTREYELAPIVAKIDRNIERMAKLGARSVTLVSRMIEAAVSDDGLMPTDDADIEQVRAELRSSLEETRVKELAVAADTLAKSYGRGGAARVAGFTAEQVGALTDEGGAADAGEGDVEPGDEAGDESLRGGPATTARPPIATARLTGEPTDAEVVDDAPVAAELAALRAEIAGLPDRIRDALVGALAQLVPPPPAPVPSSPPLLPPITLNLTTPPAPPAGKTVTARVEGTEGNRTITVESRVVGAGEGGATEPPEPPEPPPPPPPPAPND